MDADQGGLGKEEWIGAVRENCEERDGEGESEAFFAWSPPYKIVDRHWMALIEVVLEVVVVYMC